MYFLIHPGGNGFFHAVTSMYLFALLPIPTTFISELSSLYRWIAKNDFYATNEVRKIYKRGNN